MSFQIAKIIGEITSMRAKNCPKGEIRLNEQIKITEAGA